MISPRLQMIFNILALAVTGLVGGMGYWTDLFGPEAARRIVAGLSLLGIIIASCNVVMSGRSSPEAGPFIKALALIAIGLAVLAPVSARAAATDPLASIKSFITADIAGALAAAQNAAPADSDGVACYTALASAQSILANAKLSLPPKLLTDTETLWLVHQQLATVKASPACAAVCGRLMTLAASFTAIPVNLNVCAFIQKLP
jgi:hypothetical protein